MKDGNIFYFDVDGTLLDNHANTISSKTVYALNELKKQGKAIVLCTGRCLSSIEEFGYDRIVDWDGFVLSNGALVLNGQKDLIHEEYLDQDFVQVLSNESGGAVLLEGHDIFVVGDDHPRLTHAYEYYSMDPYPVRSYKNERIYNAILYSYQESSVRLKDLIKTHVKTVYDILGNHEIIPFNSGKENGSKIMSQYLNLDKEVFFGDGENDVEFLQRAHFSVAMGNAVENSKKVASLVTKSVSEDGIYFALTQEGVIDHE